MTKRRPTILQIIPELDTGGAELSTVEIADAIVRSGGRALVVSEGGRLEDRLAEAGGELIRLPVATKNPAKIISNARAIARLAGANGVDILHARSRAPAWSAWLAARATGIAFMTTYHGAYSEKGPIKRYYNSVMVRGLRVIANSNYTADLIRSRYATPADRIDVIYRGVDEAFDPAKVGPERIAAIQARWGVAPTARIVLLAGRLTSWKGQSVLIEAFSRLKDQASASDAVVVLAGDHQGRTDYRDGLMAQIQAAGLEDRVRLVGHEADMPAAFAAAHVSVVASTEPEAFGRTAIEAQAMGSPVIATRHGAPPETVLAPPEHGRDAQTGWLVAPGDAEDLARHLELALELSDEARTAIAERAVHHVQSSFTTTVMKFETLVVYNKVFDALAHGADIMRFDVGGPDQFA